MPRRNGELVFAAPWEGRAFGMVMAASEAGLIEWEGFRSRLIERIGSAAPETPYYESWLGAFEDVMAGGRMVDREEVERRAGEFRSLQREAVY